MFAKLFTLSALAILAAATPAPIPGGGESGSTCDTAPIQCCESVVPASSDSATNILKGLGVVIQDVNALVGLECSPISVVGVGSGNACSANTVCCEDNSHSSLISIGCVPISL
ncbi:hypothetical protein BN946_scf184913.g2 [Trametes cinnabarina]|uniref:Hydrophobin n=1 Tax=Pycnoporus cinnabarinus TaxID=5643 RepID=A0A060S1H3_PYCCI|nr:hypothetical protein BN946_scf184913.g2 [Trametes cinnabarina]